jgi:MFS family permease
VAHLTPAEKRSDIYAWYSLMGTAGTAFGMVTCGWALHHLLEGLNWDQVRSYRLVFYGYSVFGLVKLVLAVMLSAEVEADKLERTKPTSSDPTEQTPLLGDQSIEDTRPKRRLLPQMSRDSLFVVINLCILFSLDAFSSGLAPL